MVGKSGLAAFVGALAVCVAYCGGGGGSGSPTTPSPTPSPGGSTATVTITSNGVNPRTVSIRAGGRVTFVNNDSASHDMSSDPHPTHTNCPPIDELGVLRPNEQRETGSFTRVQSCGFHDHDNPGNGSLQGTIVVQ